MAQERTRGRGTGRGGRDTGTTRGTGREETRGGSAAPRTTDDVAMTGSSGTRQARSTTASAQGSERDTAAGGSYYSRARSRVGDRGESGAAGDWGGGFRGVGGQSGYRGERDYGRGSGYGARSGGGRYGAGGYGGGGFEQGGLGEPRGYREDVGYRGGSAAELGRGAETGWRGSWEPGWEPGRERGPVGEREGRRRWQREPVRAREIMTRDVKSVRPEAGLEEVARIMRDENTGIVPVVDENARLLGVVTDRDIVMRTLAAGNDPRTVRASEIMSDDVDAVTPDEELRDVVTLMGDKQVRRVPVVQENDELVGIISMADVATRADYDESLQDALEEISSRRSFWSRLFG